MYTPPVRDPKLEHQKKLRSALLETLAIKFLDGKNAAYSAVDNNETVIVRAPVSKELFSLDNKEGLNHIEFIKNNFLNKLNSFLDDMTVDCTNINVDISSYFKLRGEAEPIFNMQVNLHRGDYEKITDAYHKVKNNQVVNKSVEAVLKLIRDGFYQGKAKEKESLPSELNESFVITIGVSEEFVASQDENQIEIIKRLQSKMADGESFRRKIWRPQVLPSNVVCFFNVSGKSEHPSHELQVHFTLPKGEYQRIVDEYQKPSKVAESIDNRGRKVLQGQGGRAVFSSFADMVSKKSDVAETSQNIV